MAILITGAQGFVGRNLAEYFRAKRDDVLAPTVEELDLRDDVAVGRYLGEHPIESIVHCATTLRDGTSYPPDTCENNLRMFFSLQKHMRRGVRLLNLGSGSEYSRAAWRPKMREDYFDQHVPADPHSYAKYLISKHIRDSDDENLMCLRIFGIFGRYEDYRYKFISNAIAKNLMGLPIVINQNAVYDYLYISDFARLLEVTPRARIMNVTPTESIERIEIAKLINAVSAAPTEIRVLNAGKGTECTGDNRAMLETLGDFEFMQPAQAIADLYAHHEARKAELDRAALEQDPYLQYAQKLRTDALRQ
jgi:UDP-glucose 4-epimerase